ncbi:MAG: LicD family protein [Candidatus Brocadiae bacterium]|nr:LicD family protein [Candidatus Brocadiia bacterium]
MNMTKIRFSILRCWQCTSRFIHYSKVLQREHGTKKQEKTLEKLFIVVNQFLSELDVDYWIADGTLLGYYRDHRIIPNDYDVDFGLHEKEFSKVWQARKKLPPGFAMYDTSFRHRGPKLYICYQSLDVDLYFYEEKNESLRSYVISTNPREMAAFPKDFIYPIQQAIFYGQPTYIPNQTEQYLRHYYHYLGRNAVQDKKSGYWYPQSPKKQ